MKNLIIYPIIPIKTIIDNHIYDVVSMYRPGMRDMWIDSTPNILFHKNMSYGVTFLYNENSHLFTYYKHELPEKMRIAVYREKYSPEQCKLFNKYYEYDTLRALSIPFSIYTHINSYLKYKYNENVDSIQIQQINNKYYEVVIYK